jgi:hypothetical protein
MPILIVPPLAIAPVAPVGADPALAAVVATALVAAPAEVVAAALTAVVAAVDAVALVVAALLVAALLVAGVLLLVAVRAALPAVAPVSVLAAVPPPQAASKAVPAMPAVIDRIPRIACRRVSSDGVPWNIRYRCPFPGEFRARPLPSRTAMRGGCRGQRRSSTASPHRVTLPNRDHRMPSMP